MDTKAQLIEKAGHYFKDSKVKLMYATPDGNFFFENCKNYAQSHAKTKKAELFTILRADLAKPKEKPKTEEVPEEIEEVSTEEVKEEGIPEEDQDELMARYKEETGKPAIYRDKITKGYLAWKDK